MKHRRLHDPLVGWQLAVLDNKEEFLSSMRYFSLGLSAVLVEPSHSISRHLDVSSAEPISHDFYKPVSFNVVGRAPSVRWRISRIITDHTQRRGTTFIINAQRQFASSHGFRWVIAFYFPPSWCLVSCLISPPTISVGWCHSMSCEGHQKRVAYGAWWIARYSVTPTRYRVINNQFLATTRPTIENVCLTIFPNVARVVNFLISFLQLSASVSLKIM